MTIIVKLSTKTKKLKIVIGIVFLSEKLFNTEFMDQNDLELKFEILVLFQKHENWINFVKYL